MRLNLKCNISVIILFDRVRQWLIAIFQCCHVERSRDAFDIFVNLDYARWQTVALCTFHSLRKTTPVFDHPSEGGEELQRAQWDYSGFMEIIQSYVGLTDLYQNFNLCLAGIPHNQNPVGCQYRLPQMDDQL